MRPARLQARRIQPTRRTLRPPGRLPLHPPAPRLFSHKPARLLLVSHRASYRPQLPFLYPSSQRFPHGQQILRFLSISTQQKRFIKDTAKQSVKWTFYIWVISTLFSVASLGFMSERQEREFPSPHEWSLYTRFRFRRGKWWEVPEHNEDEGFPNWARLYNEYQIALKRLEDPTKDGAGIAEQEEGDILVPTLGKAGFDLTAKSAEWRQGYFEVLLGMARASERLEGWVSDKWRWNCWSPEFVASPSNPRPRMTPPGMPPVPAKEDQITIADPPENFYLRILTSKGFTTHQRVTAALGYADWLSFKKLHESAEEMYHWALDIAISGVPTPDPSPVLDPRTAVLSASAPKELITPNIINAATNLGTFYASTGNITSALPVFISVLRARLSADTAPSLPPQKARDSSFGGTLLSLLHEPEYPPVQPTGDETFTRKEEDRCEEAALKSYIGEILFATAASSAAQRQQGLNWVRDSVSTAKIAQSLGAISDSPERTKKCEQCEEVGLESWGKIMTYLAAQARDKRNAAHAPGVLNQVRQMVSGTKGLDEKVEELEDEEEGVTLRLNKLRAKMVKDDYEAMDRKYSRTFVF